MVWLDWIVLYLVITFPDIGNEGGMGHWTQSSSLVPISCLCKFIPKCQMQCTDQSNGKAGVAFEHALTRVWDLSYHWNLPEGKNCKYRKSLPSEYLRGPCMPDGERSGKKEGIGESLCIATQFPLWMCIRSYRLWNALKNFLCNIQQ